MDKKLNKITVKNVYVMHIFQAYAIYSIMIYINVDMFYELPKMM